MYKTGQRDNDVRASMRQFAHRLSDDEIADLAAYYGAP
jgi:cytochrome c553